MRGCGMRVDGLTEAAQCLMQDRFFYSDLSHCIISFIKC